MADLKTLVRREMDRAGSPSYSVVDLADRRDRRQNNRKLGTVLLALVLAAVAIAGVLRAFQMEQAPRPASLPSTPGAWTRVVLGPGEQVNAITAGGPGLVAVGFHDDGTGSPAVWTSPDGHTWTPVSDLPPGGGAMADVTMGPTGLVAVGGDASWTSADGLVWDGPSYDPALQGVSLQSVTEGGPGVVAFGTTPEGPQAWFSSDGATWQRASVPSVPGEGGISDVVVFDDRLFAMGQFVDELEVNGPMILWTSNDGMTWTDVPLDQDVGDNVGRVMSLAQGPDGLVAVGEYRYRQEVGVWKSEDGLTWRRVPTEQEAFVSNFPDGRDWWGYPGQGGFYSSPYEPGGLVSVAGGGGGYVAVGMDGQCLAPECPDAEAAVWTSTDGDAWVRVPSGPVFQGSGSEWVVARGVAAWGSRFVAWGGFDGALAIWVSGS